MANNPNQPGEYNAVKGGQAPPPSESAILGGVEGVKSRLTSGVEEQRIAALSEALKYGEADLDLVIEALQDESSQVKGAAYRLLRERTEPRVQQILQQYNPWQFCECLRTFRGYSGGGQKAVAISPDGHTLICCGSVYSTIYVYIWHLHAGELNRTLHLENLWEISGVAISPDGHTLVSSSYDDTIIKVWNLDTGTLVRTLVGHSDWVNAVAISPDGHFIVSCSGGKTINVWNLYTGELNRTILGYASRVNCLAISPDGHTLVGGSNKNDINLWNLHTGALSRTIFGHSDEVDALAISPDGQTLASGSRDKTIKLWNLHTGAWIRTLEDRPRWMKPLGIILDGKILVTGSGDKTIKLWNHETGDLVRTLVGNLVAISLDGKTIVSSNDGEIKVWGVR